MRVEEEGRQEQAGGRELNTVKRVVHQGGE